MRKLLLSLLILPLSAAAFGASTDDSYAPGDRESTYTDDPGAVAEVQAMADVTLLLTALSQDNMGIAYNVALDGYYNAVAAAESGNDPGVMWDLAAGFYGFLETGEYTNGMFTFDTDGASWRGADGTEYTLSYEEFGPWLSAVTRRPDFDLGDVADIGGSSDPWDDHGPGESPGGGESSGGDSSAAFGGPADPLGLDGPGFGPGNKRPQYDDDFGW